MLRNGRALRLTAVLGALLTLGGVVWAVPAAAETPLKGQFSGAAWGNRANAKAGDLATRLGRAAYQPCPCHGTGGRIRSNSVNNVDAGDRYHAGKVVSTAQAEKLSGKRAFAQTTSRVTNLTALAGLIKADSMEAVATVRANSTSINVVPDGSRITGLEIDGDPTTVDPGEKVTLPGFGYAVFFDVKRSGDGATRRKIGVEMMRIVITRNNDLELPIGSIITVAHASVGYSRLETDSVVGAAAWGSEATNTSDEVKNGFGRSAPAYLGCFAQGTSSGSNRVNSTNYPDVFATGHIVSNVDGAVSASASHARAVSRLESVDLLDGAVTANLIRGVAEANVGGSGGQTSFEGSHFVGLQVMGQALDGNVAPNTHIELPGLGELLLFATDASSDSDSARASVYMVILKITTPNPQGVPVGTEIKLGRARASAEEP
jgi:hypothetical protein